jgi:hypothetical protein
MDSTKPDTKKDPLHTELEDFLWTLCDPDLSPAGRVAAAIREVLTAEIHPAHREAVLRLVREFKPKALELLRHCDYPGLYAELQKFLMAFQYGGFRSAPPEPSQFDTWKFRAQDREWSDREFGWLLAALRPGEKISDLTSAMASTSSGREITRRELQLAHRPPVIPEFEWMQQFRFRPVG